jgi:hypothetical protein
MGVRRRDDQDRRQEVGHRSPAPGAPRQSGGFALFRIQAENLGNLGKRIVTVATIVLQWNGPGSSPMARNKSNGAHQRALDVLAPNQGFIEVLGKQCEIPIPGTVEGDSVDPNAGEVDLVPGVGPKLLLPRHDDPGGCAAGGFYLEGPVILLCPATCAAIQQDLAASLEIRHCVVPG